jgi:hypothetical protein
MMEIHALDVRVTEADLAELAQQALRDHDQVSDLRIRITPDGILVAGVYRLMIRVPFETLWGISILSGAIAVTLRELSAGGVCAGIFKGVLMSMIESEVEDEPGVTISGQTILLEPDRMLAAQGVKLRTNLVRVMCQSGTLVFHSEGGARPGLKAA